jgi:D-Tyr-tRNAtyr deacylase
VLQRVKSASVTVDGGLISTIGKGILVLAAVSKDDTEKDVESMAGKVLKLKMWDDEDGGRVSKRLRCWKRLISQLTILLAVETECSRYQRRSTVWYVGVISPINYAGS